MWVIFLSHTVQLFRGIPVLLQISFFKGPPSCPSRPDGEPQALRSFREASCAHKPPTRKIPRMCSFESTLSHSARQNHSAWTCVGRRDKWGYPLRRLATDVRLHDTEPLTFERCRASAERRGFPASSSPSKRGVTMGPDLLRLPRSPSNLLSGHANGPQLRGPLTLTLTHSEKSVQQSSEAWRYRHERRGHDPTKKKSVRTDVACSVGKVCTHTLLMTVCTTSNIRETRRDKINTGCCWNKFSEFKSLESSDSEQRVKGGKGIQEDNKKLEESRGRYRGSSVPPDRFPPFLRQAWWCVVSTRLGRGRHRSCQSQLFII